MLGVRLRQLQYLRETGVVVPSAVGRGRGHTSRYTYLDLLRAHLALGDLKDVSQAAQRVILADVEAAPPKALRTWRLGDHTTITVDLAQVHRELQRRLP